MTGETAGFASALYFAFIALYVASVDRGSLKRVCPALSELVADVKFTLGLAKELLKTGKYTYFEKADILSLTFEAAVFGATSRRRCPSITCSPLSGFTAPSLS